MSQTNESTEDDNSWRQCEADDCDDLASMRLRHRTEWSNSSAVLTDMLCPHHCAHREREVRAADDMVLERLNVVTEDFEWGDPSEAFRCYDVDPEREVRMLYHYLMAQDAYDETMDGETDPLLESRLQGVEAAMRLLDGEYEMTDITHTREWSEPWKD